MTFTRNALALALAIVAAAGTSGCGDLPDDVGASSLPIQGGMNDTTHLFAVGILVQATGGTNLCSGALLAPNLVATARHCVAAIPASGVVTCPSTQFGALTPANNFVVTTDADIRTNATNFGVKQVIVPTAADQASVCGHDIALLILSQNVSLPAYVTPVLSPPMTDHTVYTTTVTAIGYGVSSPSDMTGTTAGIRRIRQQIPLTCISNDSTFTDCLPSLAAEVSASEFVADDGTCEGDSGSSAFEQSNFTAGRWVSFGVLSRGGQTGAMCASSVYSRFDAWSALIIDAAKQAAAMGGYTVPPWAAPDGGVPADAGGDAQPARDAGPSADASTDAARDASSDTPGTSSDAAKDGPHDGGAPPGSDSGTPPLDARPPPSDSGSPGNGDASHPGVDSGGGGQGGSNGTGQSGPTEGGCSCSAGGTGAPGGAEAPATMLGLGVVLLAIARRRRISARVGASRPRLRAADRA